VEMFPASEEIEDGVGLWAVAYQHSGFLHLVWDVVTVDACLSIGLVDFAS
jgi:hypothetical protein